MLLELLATSMRKIAGEIKSRLRSTVNVERYIYRSIQDRYQPVKPCFCILVGATKMGLISASLIAFVLAWITYFVVGKLMVIFKQVGALQGPPALPLIGNLHQFHFKADGIICSVLLCIYA
ncbi:unnamed protein product [Gongylonema pulchrum]|uniref:Uncharacterized protein n=1 Tax=Gongylonema pulchrum TaxID=637853 RepID=A0A183D6F3_9BILA|nr:unnamed protein product [Gongylonema pulchrum]